MSDILIHPQATDPFTESLRGQLRKKRGSEILDCDVRQKLVDGKELLYRKGQSRGRLLPLVSVSYSYTVFYYTVSGHIFFVIIEQ